MMSTRSLWAALAFFPVASASPGQSLVHRNVFIDHIRTIEIEVPTGNTITVETEDLSGGCDTVLHLLDGSVEVAGDDDGGDESLASLFTFTNLNVFQTRFTLLVRAYNSNSWGTADVVITHGAEVEKLNGVPVRGARLSVDGGWPIPWIYESALAPDGAVNPKIYGLNSAMQVVAMDNNSGVGLNARMPATNVRYLLVGTASEGSRSGPVHVYANDAYLGDYDLDGLGNRLEQELGTCDWSSLFPGSAAQCTNVFNSQDTDHDGISDLHEVFGIDDPSEPQHLPRWGADPLHKDVFVEIDVNSEVAPPGLTGTEIARVQAVLAKAPAAIINNPDGQDGISLHVDAGVDPTDAEIAADPSVITLFGAWGGSGLASGKYKEAANTFRHPARFGIFRYALAWPDGGGQASGDRFVFRAGSEGTFAHELGHTMGLSHAGHSSFASVNAKPNYLSLMNYAYESKLSVGFSDGSRSWVLDPSNVAEPDGIGVQTLPPIDAFLNDKFRRPLFGPLGVDWNWSNDSERPVRTAVTFTVRGTGGEALNRNAQSLGLDIAASSTPAMVRAFGDRLIVLFVGKDGRLFVSSAETSGPDAFGSCPGGGNLGQTCCTWSAPAVVPTDELVEAVGATVFEKRLVIVYVTPDARLRRFEADGFWANQLAGLTDERQVAGVGTKVEPHVTPVYTRETGARGGLGLFVSTEDGTYRWLLAKAVDEPFELQASTFPDTAKDGDPLEGTVSPTFITWPHFDPDHDGPRHTIGVAADIERKLRVFVYDWETDAWVDQTSADLTRGAVSGKPGLAFHMIREWDGSPFSFDEHGVGKGQLWLCTTDDDGKFRMWVSSMIEATETSFKAEFEDDREGWFGNKWFGSRGGAGMTLLEDPRLSALKGVTVRSKKLNKNTPFEHTVSDVVFFPLADGTFGAHLRDANDWMIMERGIGVGIAGEGFCGTASQSLWGF